MPRLLLAVIIVLLGVTLALGQAPRSQFVSAGRVPIEQEHIPGARSVRDGDFAVAGDDGLGAELPCAAVQPLRAVHVKSTS